MAGTTVIYGAGAPHPWHTCTNAALRDAIGEQVRPPGHPRIVTIVDAANRSTFGPRRHQISRRLMAELSRCGDAAPRFCVRAEGPSMRTSLRYRVVSVDGISF